MTVDGWMALVAAVTPFLIALINRPQWSRTVKRGIMLLVAVVVAGVAAWLRGDLNGLTWESGLIYLSTFIGAVHVAYTALEAFKPTQAALDKTEMALVKQAPAEVVAAKEQVNSEAEAEFAQNVGAAAA